ncbi:MAG: filamentous hemagglutinin N-terminal domain-containing protein [Alcaligenaceae bacterium]|nr:filamentous hemagglutinin N-terminal domain-containing protein [Alcaligenaceae bacterium SAGV5]MPS50398.1 filamentous hemagglutinin N-terminal domain-containing protein [Alcaligenaceae bacterium SAGV3]MPT57941.1 filamentous hemagglutinin N-terminal domain-containing protein [Alcaligenaceae bacterium]
MKRASLNTTYRLVWSEVRGAWVAVSEIERSHGKRGGQRLRRLAEAGLMVGLLAAGAAPSWAGPLPTGGQVTSGAGVIHQSGPDMTITQSSGRLGIDWASFSIGQGNSVRFVQPDASSVAVNRVTGSDVSSIQGALKANGQVFLSNPNGVVFSPTAQVDVGGLVATTHAITEKDGKYVLQGHSGAGVVNAGAIRAADGGTVALVAARVVNQGSIEATKGNVLLGAGSKVTLDLGGPVKIKVDEGAIDALVGQGGAIRADGGQVYMTAASADALTSTVINHTGVTEARTLSTGEGGKIVLLGGMEKDRIVVAGTLDASAPTHGDGGFIETSAARVQIADDVRVTTQAAGGKSGTWLIDPVDFTIAASGGDMTGAVLGAQLGSGNVTIESSAGAATGSGNLNVNDTVDWSANTLTLTAANNVNINATLTAGGTAGLAMNPATANGADAAVAAGTVNVMPGLGRVDFTGTGNSLSINGTPYTIVTSLAQLQGIGGGLGGHYALGGDIDATATAGWNPDGSGGFAGFNPIGAAGRGLGFSGVFDGLGHTVDGLTINRPDAENVGLFGYLVDDSIVRNVGLRGGSTHGGNNTGALVGVVDGGLVSHAYSTGGVWGRDNVGGLMGSFNGRADHVYATGDVEGSGSVGGLLGYGANTSLRYAYASGNVRGRTAGGLVGAADSFSPWYTYATGDVTGTSSAGGLVGEHDHGTLWYSYATGKVTGGTTGGLIGDSDYVTVIRGYWDMDSTGQAQACGGWGTAYCSSAAGAEPIGLRTADAFRQDSYGFFNFGNDWYMAEGATRPFLRFEYATSIGNAHQLQLVNIDPSASYTLAHDIDMSVADGARASGMWSSQGFSPIGAYGHDDPAGAFTGTFDGLGHVIGGLTIDRTTAYVGLFGYVGNGGTVRNVGLANAAVSGGRYTGGLVGGSQGAIANAYATGVVKGGADTGGLVGVNQGTITNAYAAATVEGSDNTGGLVGHNLNGEISNVYATGEATSGGTSGGLVGWNDGTVTGSFYATTDAGGNAINSRAGGGSPDGVTGKRFDELRQLSTFADAGWSISDRGGDGTAWRIYDGNTGPWLRTFLTPITVTVADGGSKVYDGNTSASGTYTQSDASASLDGTAVYALDDKNAGSRTLNVSGLYSGDQRGYDISVVGASYQVTPKALDITGLAAEDKIYDGTTRATWAGAALSGVVAGDEVGLDQRAVTASFVDAEVGAGKPVALHGSFGLDGTDASNYTLIQPAAGLAADILPAFPPSAARDPKAAAAITSAQRSWPDMRARIPPRVVSASVEQGGEFNEVVRIRGSGIRLQ